MQEKNGDIIQNLILENRKKLSILGTKDVLSFDDKLVILDTDLGMLTIKGDDLRINKLSIDTGDVIVEGTISNINYSERQEKGKSNASSLIGKIFK